MADIPEDILRMEEKNKKGLRYSGNGPKCVQG